MTDVSVHISDNCCEAQQTSPHTLYQ